MKTLRYILGVFALMAYSAANAQIPLPLGDSAWTFQSALSDEFDTSALRTYKWNNNWWGGSIFNGAEISSTNNLSFNSSTLKIKADTLVPNYYEADTTKLLYYYNTPGQGLTFAYQGGVVQSKTIGYKFGYLEISAKFPSKKYPLWPAFWLFNASSVPGSDFLNEVDITENSAPVSFVGNQVGNHYHISDDTSDYDYAINSANYIDVLASGDSLSGAFHKFALEWDPDRMIFYMDDKATLVVSDTSGEKIPQNAMKLILNFCLDPYEAYLPADWTGANITPHGNGTPTQWPQYFDIEYVRYYKLTTDCSTNLSNLCTPAGYDRKVKKSITTDNTCTPTFNPSTAAGSYTLRATDYILLNEGAIINPGGTGYFAIEPTACPQ